MGENLQNPVHPVLNRLHGDSADHLPILAHPLYLGLPCSAIPCFLWILFLQHNAAGAPVSAHILGLPHSLHGQKIYVWQYDQRWKKWPWRRRGGWEQHDRGGGGGREKPQGWQWTSGPYRDGQKRMLRVLVSPGGPLSVKDSAMILFYNDFVKGNRCWEQCSKKRFSSGDEEERFVKCVNYYSTIDGAQRGTRPWGTLCFAYSVVSGRAPLPCWLRDHVVYFFFFRSHLLLLIYVASVQQLPPQTVLPILPFFPHTDLLIKAIIYGQYVNSACTPSQFPLGETHLKRMFLRAKIYRNVVDLVLWCVVFQHISITKCKMKQDLPRKNWVWLFWAHFLFFFFFLTGSIIL